MAFIASVKLLKLLPEVGCAELMVYTPPGNAVGTVIDTTDDVSEKELQVA